MENRKGLFPSGRLSRGFKPVYAFIFCPIRPAGFCVRVWRMSISKCPIWKCDGDFLWAAELSADPMVYNKLGKNYQALKQYDRAEKAYVQAAHMIPHRIYPLYLLALLYREMGDMEKARDMARQVIDQEPKVWSPAVEEMKTEMKQL